MQKFGVGTNADIARTLAMFGGFTEGLQLFASFAMLMNFPRFNKMKGMGQIVSWSVRDESLHCEGIVQLYHAFNAETGAVTPAVADDIIDCCKTVVGLEDRFIDLAFEAGEVQGMTPDGHQGLHPLHRRLAPAPAGPAAASTASPRTRFPGSRTSFPGSSTPTSSRPGPRNTPRPRRRGSWHGEEGVWAQFDRVIMARTRDRCRQSELRTRTG